MEPSHELSTADGDPRIWNLGSARFVSLCFVFTILPPPPHVNVVAVGDRSLSGAHKVTMVGDDEGARIRGQRTRSEWSKRMSDLSIALN